MSGECDKCGLDDATCKCYIYALENRILFLEEGLDGLTEIVKEISDYVRREKDER